MNRNKIVINLIILWFTVSGKAHEPLFGLGPHTIYKYGFALESEVAKNDFGWANKIELLYGVTADWAVTLSLPYLFSEPYYGMGNVVVRTKYRFYRNDMQGASRQAALHGGVSLPSQNKVNAVDFFLGASFGYESRRHYFFSGARYIYNSSIDNFKRGNVVLIDAAYGIRPWLLEYLAPDPVFLIEINGSYTGKSYAGIKEVQNTGGMVLSLSPGLLFSYRNIMLKAGVKIPVASALYGEKIIPDNEYILGIEYHFPPIY